MKKIVELSHSPHFWKRFALANIIVWTLMIPLAGITGWVDSPRFISYISLAALQLSSLAWWQSARAEMKIDQNES